MRMYINNLTTSDTKLLLRLLEGIDALLRSFSSIFTADGENVITSELERHNFTHFLSLLQTHKNESVYNAAVNIIQNHFKYE